MFRGHFRHITEAERPKQVQFTATDSYTWDGVDNTEECVAEGICNPQYIFYREDFELVLNPWGKTVSPAISLLLHAYGDHVTDAPVVHQNLKAPRLTASTSAPRTAAASASPVFPISFRLEETSCLETAPFRAPMRAFYRLHDRACLPIHCVRGEPQRDSSDAAVTNNSPLKKFNMRTKAFWNR